MYKSIRRLSDPMLTKLSYFISSHAVLDDHTGA